eukprot:g7540.t1 g7540   contig24:850301-850971(-)
MSLASLIARAPVPLFGSVRTAVAFTTAKARALPRMAGWALPLGAGALWFVWPAVNDEWKISIGLKSDPEAAAKAAAAAKEASASQKKVEDLPPAVMAKVEAAHKEHAAVETEEDKALVKMARSGDFSALESQWEEFAEKSSRPGEDDDEEEEDDDEEEEEEEEEDDE